MTIYTVRTTSGREDIVIDLLTSKIKAENLDIKSLFHPAEIKGYVFVEGSLGALHKAVHGIMHVRGIIEKSVRLEEIQHFLQYTKTRIRIDVNDMVEIIGGPFKGERGKIKRIDEVKGEVTIELLEASIPIPVTIATEFVKIVKRAKPEEKEPEEKKPEKVSEKPEEEETAFGLPLKKEEAPEEEKPEAEKPEKKMSMEDLRKELGEEEVSKAEKPKPEAAPVEEKKSILEELVEEEKKKKKKKQEEVENA